MKNKRDKSPKRRTNSSNQKVANLSIIPKAEYNPEDFFRDFPVDVSVLRAAVLDNDVEAVKEMGFETFCRQYRERLVTEDDDNHYSVLYNALWNDKAQASAENHSLNIDMLKMLMSIPDSQYEYDFYTYNPKISMKAKYHSSTRLIHVEGFEDIVVFNDVMAYYISYDVDAEGKVLNYIKDPRPDVRIQKDSGTGCTIS